MAQQRKRGNSPILEQRQAPGYALNANAPSIEKQGRHIKHTRRYVWMIVFVLTPLVGLTAVAVFFQNNQSEVAPPSSSLQVNDSIGKSTANMGVRDWLGAKPAPIPGGKLISWDGFSVKEAPELPANAGQNQLPPTYVEEVHRFTVASDQGMFDATVLVHADPINGSRMVGTPTVIPRADLGTVQWADEVPWFGFQAVPSQVDITSTVNEWAKAFISGSPATLKQTVGDESLTSAYVPLQGVKKMSINITDTAVETPESEDAPPPTWMLARVELQPQWLDQEKPKDGEKLHAITYDLLINGIDGATPKVVSWGGVGTGASLKPYSVALQDVKLAEPQDLTVEAEEESSKPAPKSDAKDPDSKTSDKPKAPEKPKKPTPPADETKKGK